MNAKANNFIMFQLGWFGCVLSAAAGYPWLGVLLAMIIVLRHVWQANDSRAELKLIISAMLVGALWDSLLVWQGWLIYSSGTLVSFIAPYWIIVMWALFATTLNLSLHWLKQRLWLAILFGAIGGPLAYLGGEKLGAVQFTEVTTALLVLSLGWAIATPLLSRIAQRFDGYNSQQVAV